MNSNAQPIIRKLRMLVNSEGTGLEHLWNADGSSSRCGRNTSRTFTTAAKPIAQAGRARSAPNSSQRLVLQLPGPYRMGPVSSPFLDRPRSDWIASNAQAFAIKDLYPVTRGHTLVVPFRQVPTWFETTQEERTALFDLIDQVKEQLDTEHRPDGYNVGFNVGEAAGQTVMHLHVHVIPRYRGDVPDPRGGVRHVIPERGNYLIGKP